MHNRTWFLASLTVAFLGTLSCKSRSYNTGGNFAGISTTMEAARGRTTTVYPAGSVQEKCITPKHFPGITYKDKDVKREDELCSYNFYKEPGDTSQPGVPVAICPKAVSTNPGVDVQELGSNNKQSYETSLCGKAERPSKLLAKFKQTITCCFTGSILSYYHLSRILDALDVPPAVIRTMSLEKHKVIASRGLNWTAGTYTHDTWSNFVSAEKDPNYYGDTLFTKDRKQIYGAMSVNARGEERYGDINMGSKSGFLNSPIVSRIFSSGGLSSMAKRSIEGAPVVYSMKDVSDILVVDYLMQQQDRFGNIHKYDYYYYLKGGKAERILVADVNQGTARPPNSVLVSRVILKDNDCGARPGNEKAVTLDDLARIRHMSPKTYRRLRWLAKQFDSTYAREFFATEALFGMPDLWGNSVSGMLEKNTKAAADTLYKNCKAGNLTLDLDFESFLRSEDSPEKLRSLCDMASVSDDGGASVETSPNTNDDSTQVVPDTVLPAVEPCSDKNYDAWICPSAGELPVYNEAGTVIGKANAGEPVCRTNKSSNGMASVFFLLPPPGEAYLQADKICSCDVPKLKICLKAGGESLTSGSCRKKYCQP